jgi:hypothetical protein
MAGHDGLIKQCMAEPENRFNLAEIAETGAEIAETGAENPVSEKTVFQVKVARILLC